MSAIWRGNWLGSQNVIRCAVEPVGRVVVNGSQTTGTATALLYLCIASVKSVKAFPAMAFPVLLDFSLQE